MSAANRFRPGQGFNGSVGDPDTITFKCLRDNAGGAFEEVTVEAGTSLNDYLNSVLSRDREYIVQVGGEDPADDHVLSSDDCVTIFSAKKDGAA